MDKYYCVFEVKPNKYSVTMPLTLDELPTGTEMYSTINEAIASCGDTTGKAYGVYDIDVDEVDPDFLDDSLIPELKDDIEASANLHTQLINGKVERYRQ